MPTPSIALIGAITAVASKHNVDIVGRRMSGRSRIAGEVAHHFRSLKYEVVEVAALPMLRNTALAAAGLAGLSESSAFRVAENIVKKIGKKPGLIIVDDWDYLDAETWAAIAHVHHTHQVPIVTTRVVNRRAAGPFSHPGVTPARGITIPKLDVAALGALAHVTFEVTLSPAALANLAALSSGDAGVAKALLSFAVEDGMLVLEDGQARLRGFSLWTEGAASIAEAMLSSLTDRQRTALETIYTHGVAPLVEVAVDSIGQELLSELADMDLVGLGQAGDGDRIVRIRSGLIVEHFRRQKSRLRMWLMMEQTRPLLEQVLARPLDGTRMTDVELLTSSFGIKRHELDDAEAKHAIAPTLATATRLLAAMDAMGVEDVRMRKLEDESWHLEGTDFESAMWGIFVFHRHIWGDGDVERVLTWLEDLATTRPAIAGAFRVQRSIWLMAQGKDPELELLPTSDEGLLPGTEMNADWARLYCLTMTGDFAAAEALVADLGGRDSLPAHFWAIASLLDIAGGRSARVVKEACERFHAARDRGGLQELAEYAYVAGLATLGAPHQVKVRDILVQFRNLGAPVRQAALIQAISTARAISGFVAGEALTPVFQNDKPLLVPSPYPAVSKEWEDAVTAAAEGKGVLAGRIAGKRGDEEWARGHKLAAAFSYLLAATADPSPRRAAAVRERVLTLGAEGLNRAAQWVLLVCDGKVETAEGVLERSRYTYAYSWKVIADQWAVRGEKQRAEAARRKAIAASEQVGRSLAGWGFPEWTPREKEVVRYLAAGLGYGEIADTLGLSPRTVEGIGSRVMKKAGVSSRAELLRRVATV